MRNCASKLTVSFCELRRRARQTVGVREIDDQIWLVSFLDYDLGYFDDERGRVEPGPNPFVPDKVETM